MKKINIAYDYEYDDIANKLTVTGEVDIVCVPDYICENLEQKVQKFFDWTDTPDSGCRKEINGKRGVLRYRRGFCQMDKPKLFRS